MVAVGAGVTYFVKVVDQTDTVTSCWVEVTSVLEAVFPSQASGMVVLTKAHVLYGYFVMQEPRKQAVVGSQVETD